MVRWCSFCQKYIGESPPYEDLSFTHGICESCVQRGVSMNQKAKLKLSEMVDLQKKLQELGSSGQVGEALVWMDDYMSKGVRPADFLMGFLAPMLHQVGPDAVKAEHFQELCNNVVKFARKQIREILSEDLRIDVLVTSPVGPYPHYLPQFFEIWLLAEGIATQSFIPEKSDDEILDYVKKIDPKIVRFALSGQDQVQATRKLIQQIQKVCDPVPLFIIGGPAIKSGAIVKADIPEAACIADSAQVLIAMRTHLSLGFLYDLKRRSS